MALGVVFEAEGHTLDQYVQVRDVVMPNGQLPAGLIYHAGGASPTGITVIEVWESKEALDSFFARSLGAALQQAGITVQPRFFEVTSTISG